MAGQNLAVKRSNALHAGNDVWVGGEAIIYVAGVVGRSSLLQRRSHECMEVHALTPSPMQAAKLLRYASLRTIE